MEYAAGGSLHSILSSTEQKSNLSPKKRLQVAETLVAAVQYLHNNEVFHRDIKPENMCFWDGWEVNLKMILIDFGIASRLVERASVAVLGGCAGTTPYMAEECLSNSPHFTEKSEVFSVGVVLLNLLTGDCLLTCLNNHRNTSPRDILPHLDSSAGPWVDGVDEDLAQLSCQCLLKDPKNRPTVSNLLSKLKSLRARICTEAYLEPRVTKRIRTYNARSRPSHALSPAGMTSCAVCGIERAEGVLCAKNHLTCSSGSCLDEVLREQLGLKKFRCPSSGCTKNFEPVDVYGIVSADLYGDLILAADGVTEKAEIVDDWKESIMNHVLDLKQRIDQSEQAIRNEIRLGAVDIISASLSVVHDDTTSLLSIETNIKSLLAMAEKQSRKQIQLEKDLGRLVEKQRRGEADTEDRQKELMGRLESLTLAHAGGVALIACGRLQCPRLCMLWPVRSHRGVRSRLTIAHEYQLFFLCAHDKSPVSTSVIIKEPKKWLSKAAPLVKFALFALRALSVACAGVALPSLPEFVTGNSLSEQMDQVLMEMEILVTPRDIRSIQDWLEDASESSLADMLESHEQAISEEAYGALVTEAYKPNNRSWMNEMEIVHKDRGAFAWVKKANAAAWKSSADTRACF
jgi:serine/threonine protein kinase